MPDRSKGITQAPGWGLGERLTTSHRKKKYISVSKPEIKSRMEGLDNGGQGPVSGCCAIEE
jgi:hypothetical protein